MIKTSILETAMYEAMRFAALKVPPDVDKALRAAYEEETEELAKMHLASFFKNAELASEGKGLVCGDTGFPIFFVRIGHMTVVEGGMTNIRKIAERAVARLTAESYLRPTMVEPLTRFNPGDNVGNGMPIVEIEFSDYIEGIEIVAAPKGGGSEIFGAFFRMLYPSDGMNGVKLFVMECIRNSCYAGKICPPAIIGVGIGGTSDLCMALAKKAAVLRKLGSNNGDERVAALEKELLAASRKLGLGPMGGSGINAVIGLHIETAHTHTAALPVSFNAQCLVGRRWKASINPAGIIEYDGKP